MTRVVNIKRTKKYDVYIGRGGDYGNPYKIGRDGTRDEVIERYKQWFYVRLSRDENFRDSIVALKGKTLGCYCKPEKCHGDVIVEFLESMTTNKQLDENL